MLATICVVFILSCTRETDQHPRSIDVCLQAPNAPEPRVGQRPVVQVYGQRRTEATGSLEAPQIYGQLATGSPKQRSLRSLELPVALLAPCDGQLGNLRCLKLRRVRF